MEEDSHIQYQAGDTLQMIVGCSSPKHNISEDEYCDGMHIKVQTVPKEMVLCADLALHQDFAQ